jgi:hypothetical protein
MSTRGIIARTTKSGWVGRYHHDSSNPKGLGKMLFDLANGHFKGKLVEMMRVLTVKHTGWSNIVGTDFNWSPGYIEHGTVQKEVMEAFSANGPKCYCHGHRAERGWIVKPEHEPQEWAYVVNAKKRTMDVLWGTAKKTWAFVRTVSFDEVEPDWAVIECGEKLERCSHYKYVHDKTVCPGCDGRKHRATSGHSTDPSYSFGSDCTSCVPPSKLPEPLKTYYFADKHTSKKNWHCYDPKICDLCAGTGVQTLDQWALRKLISAELRRQYKAKEAAEQALLEEKVA